MKNYVLIAAAILFGATAHAQFYVAASGGYAFGSAGARTGIERLNGGIYKAYYGSAGQGANGQLRVGYFFNETFGIDLGFGYLASQEQNVSKIINATTTLKATNQSNVIGFSPSLVYRFSSNVYGRFGALLKIAGSTVVNGTVQIWDNTTNNKVADLYSFKANASGQLPFGFLGALGYKYKLNDKISLFVEGEYMGISVKSKSLEITEVNGKVPVPDGSGGKKMENITLKNYKAITGNSLKTEYKDESDNPANLANKTPYSSFGLNFGVMYSF